MAKRLWRAVFTLKHGNVQRTSVRVMQQSSGSPNLDGYYVDIPALRQGTDFDHYSYHDNGHSHRSRRSTGGKRLYDAVRDSTPLDKLAAPQFLVFAHLGIWPYDKDTWLKLDAEDPRLQLVHELDKLRWHANDDIVNLNKPDAPAVFVACWMIPNRSPEPPLPHADIILQRRFCNRDPHLFVVVGAVRAREAGQNGMFYGSPVSPWEDGRWKKWT